MKKYFKTLFHYLNRLNHLNGCSSGSTPSTSNPIIIIIVIIFLCFALLEVARNYGLVGGGDGSEGGDDDAFSRDSVVP